MVVDQATDVKVFDHDKGVAINVRPRRLVRMVLALTSNLEVPLRNVASGLLASLGAFLTPRSLALRPPEVLPRAAIVARVLNRPAFGIREKDLETNVETNGGTVSFLRRFSEIADDKDVPVPIGSEDDIRGLGNPFERPVLLDLDPAPELPGDMELLALEVEVHVPSAAILPEPYRVPAVGGLEARKADLLSKLFTAEEPFAGFVQAVGKSLDGALRDVLAPASFEAIRKIVAAEKRTRLVVMVFDHLKHLVVDLAAPRQARKELSMLNAVGIKPIFEGFVHSLSSTASGSCTQRPFTSCLKAMVPGSIFL
jgi:hypothetical protein